MRHWVASLIILAGGVSMRAEACTVKVPIRDTIGIGSLDIMERGFAAVAERSCTALLLAINTPGGNLQTTRMMVEKILNSPIPVLCLVTPSGAHAGSAGAILLQACHVAGGLGATNIGAATPILASGQSMPEDLRKKMINDTSSWVEGLAQHHKRDQTFAREIVTIARSVSAEEAFKLGAIDTVSKDEFEFLKFSEGRKVAMSGGKTQTVSVGDVHEFPLDVRYKILSLVSDPELVYLIFLGSLGLLYFELTHTGFMVPGILGALGLVVSLISFHKLQVEWGGLLLIFLGVAFLIAELFVTSFGVLGLSGVVSFVLGGLFLFDPQTSGYSLPVRLVMTTGVSIGLAMFGLAYLAFRTRNLKTAVGVESLVGQLGRVSALEPDGRRGQIDIQGEIWRFESESPVGQGSSVEVVKIEGLTAFVRVTPQKQG